MAIKRRTFLQTLALGSCGLMSFSPYSAANIVEGGTIIGACRVSAQDYGIACINLQGEVLWQQPLPARGHEIALHPSLPIGVAVARRPERFLFMFNSQTGEEITTVFVDQDIKLNGHAVWNNDELIVSASDKLESNMRLMSFQWDNALQTLSYQGESVFDFLGPHQMVLNQGSLWIAIGGLKTSGRDVLNKQNVESSLIQLNANTKSLLAKYDAPEAGVSLRHLSISETGDLFIAGQYQLDVKKSPALLFKLEGDSLKPFNIEPEFWSRINGYVGSIACSGSSVIASSPRGHWLGEFDQQTLELKHQLLSRDVCALVDTPIGAIAGTGAGYVHTNSSRIPTSIRWDNHFSFCSSQKAQANRLS